MTLLIRFFRSSIGKKQLVALTGIALLGFLVVHLAGNLLLFVGPEAFDGYAHLLEGNPLLIPSELILLLVFLIHIALALQSNIENWRARPQRYVVRGSKGAKNAANSTMVFSGVLVLIFVISHLIHFKFGTRVQFSEEMEPSLYWLVIKTFKSLPYVVWYIFSVCVLALHVAHGFKSLFQTLGFHHDRCTPAIRWLSALLALVFAVGYGIMPLYAYFWVDFPNGS